MFFMNQSPRRPRRPKRLAAGEAESVGWRATYRLLRAQRPAAEFRERRPEASVGPQRACHCKNHRQDGAVSECATGSLEALSLWVNLKPRGQPREMCR